MCHACLFKALFEAFRPWLISEPSLCALLVPSWRGVQKCMGSAQVLLLPSVRLTRRNLPSTGKVSLIVAAGVSCVCLPFAVAKRLCATVALSSLGAGCTKCSTTTITAAEMQQACLQAAKMLTLRGPLSPSQPGSTEGLFTRGLGPCRSLVSLDVHSFSWRLGSWIGVEACAPLPIFVCIYWTNMHHVRLSIAKTSSTCSNLVQILPSADFIRINRFFLFCSLCAF